MVVKRLVVVTVRAVAVNEHYRLMVLRQAAQARRVRAKDRGWAGLGGLAGWLGAGLAWLGRWLLGEV